MESENGEVSENDCRPNSVSETGSEKASLSFRGHMFILTMGFLVMSDLFYTYSIVTYVADIVVDFGMTDDKKEAGFYTGLLISAYFMGLFFSSIPWALISDRFGRRRILIVSLSCIITLWILSAFTFCYHYLLLIRFLMGLLSGMLPITKTAIGENTNIPVDSLPYAFSALNFWNCFGSVIAPVISGTFSRPTKQYPWIFESSDHNRWVRMMRDILDIFPLLLPNIVSGLILLVGLFLLYRYGYETNYRFIQKSQAKDQDEESDKKEEKSLNSSELSEESSIESGKPVASSSIEITSEEEYTSINSSIETETETELELETGSESDDSGTNETEEEVVVLTKREKYIDPVIAILTYATMNIGVLIFVRTVPVQWSMLAEDKGLGLLNWQIGILGFTIGASGCLSALVAPPFIRYFSPVWVIRILPLSMLILVPFYPELSYLRVSDQRWTFWIIVILLTIVRSSVITTLYTSIVLIMSNSATKERRGFIQGLANGIGGFGKGLGPLIGNYLLSIGCKWINVFPFDIHFTFFVSCFLFVCVCLLGFTLPRSLRYPVDYKHKK